PSHICGNRHLLQEVTQNAIDLNYDGIIIESHIDPDNAWSDAKQQITPAQLTDLLQKIIWRQDEITSHELHELLEDFRQQINKIDDEVIQLLSKRMKLADEIGHYKKDHDITILQTKRWDEVLERVSHMGMQLGLSKEFVIHYFNAIHMESIKHQDAVMNRS